MQENKLMTILKVHAGSTLYGLRTAFSDEDYRGCVMPLDPEYLFGFRNFEQLEVHNPDMVMYNVTKFLSLAFSGNTVALECLFSPDMHVVEENSLGKYLRDSAPLFLSKRCFKVFGGYCKAEMHRAIGETTGKLGAARKEQLQKYGYVLKAASHCMRLLYTAIELFKHRTYIVSWEEGDWRREILMGLKLGIFTREEFLEQFEEANSEFESFKNSLWLPDAPCEVEILGGVLKYYVQYAKTKGEVDE